MFRYLPSLKSTVQPFFEMSTVLMYLWYQNLGRITIATHSIDITRNDIRQVHPAPCRTELTLRQFTMTGSNITIAKKVIEPATTEWGVLIVNFFKKDGWFCFCVDYRNRTTVIIRDSYAFLQLKEYIDRLGEVILLYTLKADSICSKFKYMNEIATK